MEVEIWSDVVCPWCYVGKRRFEAALARLPQRDDVTVRYRSFELDPNAPTDTHVDLLAHLAAKYGVSLHEAAAMNDRVTAAAAGEGLTLRLDIARRGSTFDAHRLLHLADDRGRQAVLKEALLAAYQTDGRPIADHATLADVATATGLDRAEVQAVLDGDAYADAVRADEDEARGLGITAVPCFVVDRRHTVSGAQRPELLLRLLEGALAE